MFSLVTNSYFMVLLSKGNIKQMCQKNVILGDYANPGEREVSVWKWNGWGFSKISTVNLRICNFGCLYYFS